MCHGKGFCNQSNIPGTFGSKKSMLFAYSPSPEILKNCKYVLLVDIFLFFPFFSPMNSLIWKWFESRNKKSQTWSTKTKSVSSRKLVYFIASVGMFWWRCENQPVNWLILSKRQLIPVMHPTPYRTQSYTPYFYLLYMSSLSPLCNLLHSFICCTHLLT